MVSKYIFVENNKTGIFSIWLYVIIKSCTSFRVNLHSIVYLNVNKLLPRSRRHIWSFSDGNRIWTHNHLFRERTLNDFAKLACLANWLRVRLRTKWLWVLIPLLFSLYLDLLSKVRLSPSIQLENNFSILLFFTIMYLLLILLFTKHCIPTVIFLKWNYCFLKLERSIENIKYSIERHTASLENCFSCKLSSQVTLRLRWDNKSRVLLVLK